MVDSHQKANQRFSLDFSDSYELKGIALLMLLFHHLFYIRNGLYDDIALGGTNVVQYVALACKLCVAVFVFLSGYELASKYIPCPDIRAFFCATKTPHFPCAERWRFQSRFLNVYCVIFRCSPDTSDTPRVGDANRECGKTAGLVLPA